MLKNLLAARGRARSIGIARRLSLYAEPITFDDIERYHTIGFERAIVATGGRTTDQTLHSVDELALTIVEPANSSRPTRPWRTPCSPWYRQETSVLVGTQLVGGYKRNVRGRENIQQQPFAAVGTLATVFSRARDFCERRLVYGT